MDVDESNGDNTLENTRKCSKKWCQKRVPLDVTFKQCPRCRAVDARNQQAKRAAASSTASSSTGKARAQKRSRSHSSTEADPRPMNRARQQHEGSTADDGEPNHKTMESDDEVFEESGNEVHYLN
ncbi:hypothetical protein R3P38DRAFT_1320714 [Favolaschia claudopus]|uniref:Uncharacterized protein n=1 Tax=Favolaschia claudopus TaxID=2862362 RepID=A0AAW0AUX6_9AGAR